MESIDFFLHFRLAALKRVSKRHAMILLSPSLHFRKVLRARWRGSGLSIFGCEEKRQRKKAQADLSCFWGSLHFIFIPHVTTWNRCSKLTIIPNVNVFHVFHCQVGPDVFVWTQRCHFNITCQDTWGVPDQSPPGSLRLYLSLLLRAITGLQQQL